MKTEVKERVSSQSLVGTVHRFGDINSTLEQFGFERIQGSVYVTKSEDMANLFQAIMDLKALAWFAPSVRDIR